MTNNHRHKKISGGGPLMPRSQMPLRTLMVAMTIMCYLACLAIGALVLINRAVNDWSSDIAGQVTVQIRPDGSGKMAKRLETAAQILQQAKGVKLVEVLKDEAGRRLLEPWLGDADILTQLPIPRLIAVTIDRKNPPDLAAIARRLKKDVPGASLDTHRRWQGELTRMGASLVLLGVAVLILIAVSAVFLVIYASRSAMDANRQAVEVLHFVGASDPYIARQVQWQFLKAGLKSGLAGTLGGMATFLILGLTRDKAAPNGLADASYSLLIGAPEVTVSSYLTLLIVPVVATLICLVAARLSILRILHNAV